MTANDTDSLTDFDNSVWTTDHVVTVSIANNHCELDGKAEVLVLKRS